MPTKRAPKHVRLTVRLPEKLSDMIERLAAAENRTKGGQIVDMLVSESIRRLPRKPEAPSPAPPTDTPTIPTPTAEA